MKRIALILTVAVACASTAVAQQRILGDVKKKISSLTLTADVYKNAINTLAPALKSEETMNLAETWYLQGKLQYGYYDKCMDSKAVGKKVDVKAMGHALIDGYDAYLRSLPLDTVYELDKNGNAKLDKNGNRKFKTKYSAEVIKNIISHHHDYNVMGGELYNVKDWDGALKSWEIFCDMPSRLGINALPDSVVGQTRYYQALAMWQKSDNAGAVKYFEKARKHGYVKKECFDYALVCLSALGDEHAIIKLAQEAYQQHGSDGPQYVRILINDNINKQEFDKANVLLDEIIAVNDSDAEIFNLKGVVVEHQQGMEQAHEYFKKCVELDPDSPQGQFNMGRYYYNEATSIPEKFPRLSGRKLAEKVNPLYRQALPYLEKAYQLDPSNEEVKNALRNIYYKLGEGQKLQQIEQ